MGWMDFFKQKKKGPDPLKDLTLANLRVGYYVDYDMQSWEVTACNHYDWGSDDITYEWQLKSSDQTIYLEREPDDEDFWSISRKIGIEQLGGGLKAHIIENGDPPEQIEYEGRTYYLEETGGGYFHSGSTQDAQQTGRELLKWDFTDDSGERFVGIEQWGETEFEASTGKAVEEYQFTNILPVENTNQ